ncbi:hypothetical protein [Methanobrevibacter sp.]|uniref:hypothetical protein n=1 Tax=Methanobrevibacter sp. TaxID=66852 RepID=UPI00388E3548
MDIQSVIIIIIALLGMLGIFLFLAYATKFIVNKIKSNPSFKNSKFLNPTEYFPVEQLASLKQVFYLLMIFVFIVISLYLIFDWGEGAYPIFILDIIVSIYLFINSDSESLKDKIILFLLVPFGSIAKLLIGYNSPDFLDLFHIFGYLYFSYVYDRKFMKYTETMGIGISIILLFSIILFSFIFTMFAEDVSPLNSIAMVSNAFTSNSYDPAGNSVVGKLDSLLLAWGGYILSFVGTATLAVSIVNRYVDRQFDDLEELIKSKKKEK